MSFTTGLTAVQQTSERFVIRITGIFEDNRLYSSIAVFVYWSPKINFLAFLVNTNESRLLYDSKELM